MIMKTPNIIHSQKATFTIAFNPFPIFINYSLNPSDLSIKSAIKNSSIAKKNKNPVVLRSNNM